MYYDFRAASQIDLTDHDSYLNPLPETSTAVRVDIQFDQPVSQATHTGKWPFKVDQGIVRTMLAYRQCGQSEYGPLPAVVFEAPDGMVYAINDCALFLSEECSWESFEDIALPSDVAPQIRVLAFLEASRDHPEFEPFRKYVPSVHNTLPS